MHRLIRNSQLANKLREERGLALVETALVILLILFVTFAMMEYGWLFHRLQQLNNGVREGARIAVLPDKTAGDAIAAVDGLMGDFGIAGADVAVNPADTSDLESGDLITVTVEVPVNNIMLTGLFLDEAFLGDTVTVTATMAKESP